jgi:hypothetical protein
MGWRGNEEMVSEHAFSTTLLLLCRLGNRKEDDKKRKRRRCVAFRSAFYLHQYLSYQAREQSGWKNDGADRSQDHWTIWRYPTLSALLYKYSSITYILLDWSFAIVADCPPFSFHNVRPKVPPYREWQPRY